MGEARKNRGIPFGFQTPDLRYCTVPSAPGVPRGDSCDTVWKPNRENVFGAVEIYRKRKLPSQPGVAYGFQVEFQNARSEPGINQSSFCDLMWKPNSSYIEGGVKLYKRNGRSSTPGVGIGVGDGCIAPFN